MKSFDTIAVILELGKEDEPLLQYAAAFSRLAATRSIHFIHVVQDDDLPEAVRIMHSDALACPDDSCIEAMRAIVKENFECPPGLEVSYKVIKGSPLSDLPAYLRDTNQDLVMVTVGEGNEVLARRLARKAICSALILPKDFKTGFKKIFAAIDFSESSRGAIETAVEIASAAGAEKIWSLYIYNVPAGYHKSGKTYEEFDAIIRQHAAGEYEALLKDTELKGMQAPLILKTGVKPFQGIRDKARELDADLLVMGARGRGNPRAVLLGSVTERLVGSCSSPILAYRKKGETLHILNALFSNP